MRPATTPYAPSRAKRRGAAAIALATTLLWACGGPTTAEPIPNPSPAAAAPSPAPTSTGQPDVAATFGDQSITLEEVDHAARAGLMAAQQQAYNARSQAVEKLVIDKLLEQEAAKHGITADELVKREVTDKTEPVTDDAVQKFYDDNRAQMRADFATMQPQIRQHLEQQASTAKHQAYVDGLQTAAGVTIFLEPPRYKVEAGEAPRRGPVDAAVEIIEFSDFECPYCTRAAKTVEEIQEKYGDSVSVVYRHFPLPFHQNAKRAAEASECAHDQGAFWKYHDELFANQRALDDASLTKYATNTGLDVAAFQECLASGKHSAKVDKDLEDGQAVGVTGTPGFFINGISLSGALPLDAFTEVIDAELARTSGG